MNRRSLLTGVGRGLSAAIMTSAGFPVGARAEDMVTLPFGNGHRPLVRTQASGRSFNSPPARRNSRRLSRSSTKA
jgi:hypothetical protein